MAEVRDLRLQPYEARCNPTPVHQAILASMSATLSPNSALALDGKPYMHPDTVYLARAHVKV